MAKKFLVTMVYLAESAAARSIEVKFSRRHEAVALYEKATEGWEANCLNGLQTTLRNYVVKFGDPERGLSVTVPATQVIEISLKEDE